MCQIHVSTPSSIEQLPPEVLGKVLQQVPWISKIMDCQLVSKDWYQILKDPVIKELWGELFLNVNSPDTSLLWEASRKEGLEEWLRRRARGISSVYVKADVRVGCQQEQLRRAREFMDIMGHIGAGLLSGIPISLCVTGSVIFHGVHAPKWTSALTSLHIILDNNAITVRQLHALASLSALRHLDLEVSERQGGITGTPGPLAALTLLQSLRCAWHPNLIGLPDDFRCLQGLSSLVLESCRLAAFPPVIAKLSGLAHLDLQGNHSLGMMDFPRSLRGLQQLTSLNVSRCGLSAFPEFLITLPSLLALSGQGNNFKTNWLPHPVEAAPLLKVLDVSFNHAIALPNHLQDFTKLQVLKLHCCGFMSIPIILQSMKGLQVNI